MNPVLSTPVSASELDALCVRTLRFLSLNAQSKEYRDTVLSPSTSARLAVETGVSHGWHRYVGDRGDVLGVERFGASCSR